MSVNDEVRALQNQRTWKYKSASAYKKELKKKKKEEEEPKYWFDEGPIIRHNYHDASDILDEMVESRKNQPKPKVTGSSKTKTSADTDPNDDTSFTDSIVRGAAGIRDTALNYLKQGISSISSIPSIQVKTAQENKEKYASGTPQPTLQEQMKQYQNGDGTQLSKSKKNLSLQEQMELYKNGDGTTLQGLTPEEAVEMRSKVKKWDTDRPSFMSAFLPNSNERVGSRISKAIRSTGNPEGKDPFEQFPVTGDSLRRAQNYQAAINDKNNPLIRAEQEATKMGADRQGIPEVFRAYLIMTPEEQQRYNELYGEYGVNKAEDFRAMLQDTLNQRMAQENYDTTSLLQNPVGRVAGAFKSGVSRFGEGLENTGRWALGLNNTTANSVDQYEAAIYKENAANGAEKVAQDLASTIGYMAPSILGSGMGQAANIANAGTLSNAVLGIGTGGNAYQESINEGYGTGSASLYAAQQAVDEVVTEKLLGGINAFGGGVARKLLGNTRAVQAARNGIKNFAKTPSGKILMDRIMSHSADAFSEGAQEFVQHFTDLIARNLIFDEDNEIDPTDPEAWYSAALGAANALLFNVGGDALHLANNEVQHRKQRRQEQKDQEVRENYVDLGKNEVNEVVNDAVDEAIAKAGGEDTTENIQSEYSQAVEPVAETTVDTNQIQIETPEVQNEEVSGSVPEVKKSVSEEVSSDVNAAVDALKAQIEEDHSESTPEEAKASVKTAVEELKAENESEVPADNTSEVINAAVDNLIGDTGNASNTSLSDILEVSNKANLNGFEYNITETSNGFHGTIRNTSNDVGNISDARSTRYTYDGPTREDVIRQLVGVAENNGFVEPTTPAETTTPVAPAEPVAPQAPRVSAEQAAIDEINRRADARFPSDPDASNVYKGFYQAYQANDGGNDVDIYDHFMAMAYQAGLDGNPLSSLSDNAAFNTFVGMYPSMIDAIWRTGYNRYEANQRAEQKSEKKPQKTSEKPKKTSEIPEKTFEKTEEPEAYEEEPDETVDNVNEEENGGNSNDEESRDDSRAEGQPEPVQSGTVEGHGEVHTEEAGEVGDERGSVREAENDRGSDDGDVSPDAGSGSGRLPGDGSSEGVQVRDNERGSGGVEEEQQEAPLAPETVEEVQEQKEDVALQDMPKGNNFVLTPEFAKTIPSTPAKRLSANIDALKTLKNIMSENRIATPEEQQLLAAFTGWGGIGDANWKKAEKALTNVLTKDELEHARASITDAYYTNPSIITSIYNGLSDLGFKGGKLLEPSAGVGRFIGTMPASLMPKSRWMAVELDSVSGNIAKLLYPEADVRVQGFQDAKIIDNYMDAVIGNVPFGNFGVVDKRYPDAVTSMIHNYFVARALDTLRPGGVACLITSKGTLDADAYSSKRVRQYFADKANLVGAIRLPETAFKGTGTSVVTDILVFQKREKDAPYSGEAFVEMGYMDGVSQNEYFVKHPEMVLGKYEKTTGQYGRPVVTVKPKSGSLESQIEKAFKKINLKMKYPEVNIHDETVKSVKAARNKKEGTAYKKDGKLYLNKDGQEQELKLAKTAMDIYSDAVNIRDTAKALIADMQLGKPTAEDRAKLNESYDAFIKKYPQGFHQSSVKKVLCNDTDYAFLQALERVSKEGKKVTVKKADIFTKDTIKANTVVSHVDNLSDGIETSLNQLGRVDTDRIASLMDKPKEEVEKEIDQSDLAYRDGNGNFVSAQNYLSGNVRAKLKEAEMLAEGRPEYKKNVKALKKVVPKEIKGYDININMGTTWIAPEYYARFAEHLLGAPNDSIKVTYLSGVGYNVEYNRNSRYIYGSAENTSKWGDKKHNYPFMPVSSKQPGLFYSILNNKNLEVKYTVEDSEGKKKTVHDEIAEAALKDLKAKINDEFNAWLWKDAERTKTLETTYNDLYNCMVNPNYDSNVMIPGQSATISLRDHQASAINRVIQSPYNVIMEHGVGAGKTFAAIGAIMKSKQLGLCTKPTIVVPKNKVDDWAGDFYKLFPGATVLKADDDTFSTDNRKEFINKVATSDVDAVIISYEQFTKISMSKEYEENFYKQELEKIKSIIEESGSKRNATTMQLETKKKRFETKIRKLNEVERDTDNISFEDTGIDWVYVDEAQNYKNLAYFTNLKNVADMGDAEGSDRAWDLKMKTDYLRSMQNGKGVTLLTATPIMNSPVEAYSMLRYTHEETLNKMGILTLDDFIQAFGKIEQITRQDAAGRSWKLRTTFNGFINLREWSSLWRSVVDRVRTQDVPGIQLPKIKGGERTVVKCQATPYSRDVIRGLADRLKNKSQKGENHVFAIQSDAKKASFSQHLLDPQLPYGETEKVPVACNKIYDIWKESKTFKDADGNDVENGVQLVFCDYGTPKKKKKNEKIDAETSVTDDGETEEVTIEGVNVYKDMKDMLVAKGIPAEEIAFIQDYSGDAKAKLYDKVREGKVRVLIGSTKTMGEGLNVQDRIVAMHEMNPVQRPGDVEQLEGRGIRQGNRSPEVGIYVYVTEDTFDTKQWENIWIKADYISQIEDGVYEGREMEYNTNEFGSSAGDIMAIASGNPMLKEQTEVNDKLRKLKGLKAEHSRKTYDANQQVSRLERQIAYNEEQIPKFKEDEKKVTDLTGDKFKAVIAGKTITDREAFGEELIKYTQKAINDMDKKPRKVGKISGFDIYVSGVIPAAVELRGAASYTNALNLENAKGCTMRVTNLLNSIPGKAEAYQKEVENAKQQIPKFKEIAESKFDKEEELEKTEARAAKIESDLRKYQADEPVKNDNDVLYSRSKPQKVRTKPEQQTVKEIEEENKKLKEQKKKDRENGRNTTNVDELENDNSKQWNAAKNKGSSTSNKERLSDIIGKAMHDFGINYTSGARYVKGKGVEGEYNRKNHGIRTKVTNDLPRVSHEFGHWFDQKYDMINDNVPRDVLKNLKAAFEKNPDNKSNYTDDLVPFEGFAEFIRMYLQNRDTAVIDYPELADYVFSKLNPEDLARFNVFADQVNAYYSEGADSAEQHIRLKEDSRPDYRTRMERFRDAWNHGYQVWVDSNHGIKLFDRANNSNVYTFAANAAYTDARIIQTLTNAIYSAPGYYAGPSLMTALTGLNVKNKKEYMDFGEYLIICHAQEWLEQRKRVFADDRKNNRQWLENRQKELEEAYPKFPEIAARVYEFQARFLEVWGVATGLITEDHFNRMQAVYPKYVPFFRAGFKERGNALKQAKGSGRDIIHPIDNIIDSVTRTMHTATWNMIPQMLIEANPDANFLEEIPAPTFAEKFDTTGLKKKLMDETAVTLWGMQASTDAVDAMQDIIDEIDDTLIQYRMGRALKNRNEIRVMVNGEPKYYKVNNELLMASLMDLDNRETSDVIRAFAKMNRFMTFVTTGGNIVWSTTSNSVRDLLTMALYAPDKKPGKLLSGIGEEYINSLKRAAGKEVDPIYQQYLALGGDESNIYSGSERYVKDVRKLLENKKKLSPLALTEFISSTVESGPRYSIFKMLVKQGVKPQEAFRAAMDITVDFKRHGKNSKMMNNFILYFNASLQGVDKFVRYFTAEDKYGKRDRKKTIMNRTLFLMTLSMIGAALTYYMNHDDEEKKEDYNLLSNYTKNNFYSIPIPGEKGKYLTLPKAHETAVLESFMERLLEYSLDHNKHAFDEFYDYGVEQFSPSGVSAALKLPVNAVTKGPDQAGREFLSGVFSGMGPLGVGEQIAANRNYIGRPIETTYEQDNLEPSQRYNENTSQAAYLAGKYFNVSPKMVDHFGTNVLGYMWDYPAALFPIDDGEGTKGQRDLTLGIGRTYVRDNTYSNDVTNYIYDQANKSARIKNSTGENTAEAKIDSNMASFYTTFNKLSREEPDSAGKSATRREVLNELLTYRDKTGALPKSRQDIYDFVNQTGDSSVLPSVMPGTVKDSNKKEYALSASEYVDYQKSYDDYYWKYAEESFNPSESAEKKTFAMKKAQELARDQATDEMLRQKGIRQEKTNKLLDFVQSGNDFDDYVDTVYEINEIKDAYSGSDNKERRQDAIASAIRSAGVSESARQKLWEIAGYKVTEKSYGKYF